MQILIQSDEHGNWYFEHDPRRPNHPLLTLVIEIDDESTLHARGNDFDFDGELYTAGMMHEEAAMCTSDLQIVAAFY